MPPLDLPMSAHLYGGGGSGGDPGDEQVLIYMGVVG